MSAKERAESLVTLARSLGLTAEMFLSDPEDSQVDYSCVVVMPDEDRLHAAFYECECDEDCRSGCDCADGVKHSCWLASERPHQSWWEDEEPEATLREIMGAE